MTEHEFTLADRIAKIKSINEQYDLEHNGYIAFSGGKDSTVLHYLIDEALPGNNIPRVYVSTGIDYKLISDFVQNLQKKDNRIVIIRPINSVRKVLEQHGYPFKSKIHSMCVEYFQTDRTKNMWKGYTGQRPEYWHSRTCPKKLMYQFTDDFKLKISDKCCFYMKEEPMQRWQKENNRTVAITGIMREEGGRRMSSSCAVFKGKKLSRFQPLVPVTKEWEEWYIGISNITLCPLYYAPFNFERTGCKGCPFNVELEKDLASLREKLPSEAKQCEIIWKPVYDEYRRIGYRLKENK